MTATVTSSSAKTNVNVVARSICATTTAALRLLLHVTNARGVPIGSLSNNFETIERGIRVWLTMRELQAIVLELYDAEEKFIEAFEFEIAYDECPSREEHFDVKIDEFRAALAGLPKSQAKSYRVVVTFTAKEHMPVRGWAKCKRNDVSKLKKVKLSNKVSSTAAIDLNAYAFIGGDDYEPFS